MLVLVPSFLGAKVAIGLIELQFEVSLVVLVLVEETNVLNCFHNSTFDPMTRDF